MEIEYTVDWHADVDWHTVCQSSLITPLDGVMFNGFSSSDGAMLYFYLMLNMISEMTSVSVFQNEMCMMSFWYHVNPQQS